MKSYYYILDHEEDTILCRIDTIKEAQEIAEKEAIMHPSKTFKILKLIGFSQTSAANTFWMDGEEPKQEPQYRMLKKGDQINRRMDQYLKNGEWLNFTNCLDRIEYFEPQWHAPIRRPITPNNQ